MVQLIVLAQQNHSKFYFFNNSAINAPIAQYLRRTDLPVFRVPDHTCLFKYFKTRLFVGRYICDMVLKAKPYTIELKHIESQYMATLVPNNFIVPKSYL